MKPLIDINTVATDPNLLGKYYSGPTWRNWRCILNASMGIAPSEEDQEIFNELAGGRAAPKQPVRELWAIAGRRGGKDSIAALLVTYIAVFYDHSQFLRNCSPTS